MPRQYIRKTSSPEELSRALSEGGKKNKGVPKSLEARKKLSETRKRLIAEGKLRSGNAKKRTIPSVDHVSDDFGHWLAGFVDGEGCFFVHSQGNDRIQTAFRISLRIDDDNVIQLISGVLDFGQTRHSKPKDRNPVTHFDVSSFAGCMALVVLFRRFPLRSKKRLDFEAWAEIVERGFHEYKLSYSECLPLIERMQQVKHYGE